MSYYSIFKQSYIKFSRNLSIFFFFFNWNFQNTLKHRLCLETKVWILYFRRVINMLFATFSFTSKFKGWMRFVYIWLKTFVKERWKNEGRNYTKHFNIPKTVFCRSRCFYLLLQFFGNRFVMHRFIFLSLQLRSDI